LRYVQSGVDSGASLVTGGDRVGNMGFYVQPTVFVNAKVRLSELLPKHVLRFCSELAQWSHHFCGVWLM